MKSWLVPQRTLCGQNGHGLEMLSEEWIHPVVNSKLDNVQNFYLEAFSVLTIDKVKAQKWPILLILLPGRYWALGLKILFVAEIEKLLPARQPLTTTDGSWTPGLGKISKGFYTENYFPLMVNWLFFFHIRFVEVAVASYFLRYFLNLKQLLLCGSKPQQITIAG